MCQQGFSADKMVFQPLLAQACIMPVTGQMRMLNYRTGYIEKFSPNDKGFVERDSHVHYGCD
jgi:hypothetical protein